MSEMANGNLGDTVEIILKKLKLSSEIKSSVAAAKITAKMCVMHWVFLSD